MRRREYLDLGAVLLPYSIDLLGEFRFEWSDYRWLGLLNIDMRRGELG